MRPKLTFKKGRRLRSEPHPDSCWWGERPERPGKANRTPARDVRATLGALLKLSGADHKKALRGIDLETERQLEAAAIRIRGVDNTRALWDYPEGVIREIEREALSRFKPNGRPRKVDARLVAREYREALASGQEKNTAKTVAKKSGVSVSTVKRSARKYKKG